MSLAAVVVERNIISYRRQWLAFTTGFLEPLFYLLSLGLGLGSLISGVTLGNGEVVTYAQFVAPAMLAMSAMNGAVFDATFGIYFKLKWSHTFDAMLSTPVTPADIALGETTWSLVRSTTYVAGFLVFSTALGLTLSWWAVLAVPAAILIGFAFSTVGMAGTTWIRNFQDFDFISLGLVPLTLLSGTFFPVDQYPDGLRWLVQLSPLYHGVVVERGLVLGDVDWWILVHLAVLAAMGLVGFVVARRRLATLLLT